MIEEIFGVVWGILNWRVVLCIVGTMAAVFGLFGILGFNLGAGTVFNLLLLSGTAGVVWQARSEAGGEIEDSTKFPKISRPIAFIGLAFFGGLLGVIESAIFESAALGALALIVVSVLIALWHRLIQCQKMSRNSFIFLVVSLLAGFSGMLLLNFLTA